MEGIINVLKPPGMTSHDVVYFIRRLLGVKKVGHGGTLDPAAAGVLPIFVGRATKAVELFGDDDKEYIAEIVFGITTDTGDSQGRILNVKDDFTLNAAALEPVLKKFTGLCDQLPPMYSAVHHKGRRLYELAREGITVERKPRKIRIENIELLDLHSYTARIRVVCSKGTYVRTLCEDIGRGVGIGACLGTLVRTRTGCFKISSSNTLEELSQDKSNDINGFLIPIDKALENLPAVMVDLHSAAPVGKGANFKFISDAQLKSGDLVKVYGNGIFLAVGTINHDLMSLKIIKTFYKVDKHDNE